MRARLPTQRALRLKVFVRNVLGTHPVFDRYFLTAWLFCYVTGSCTVEKGLVSDAIDNTAFFPKKQFRHNYFASLCYQELYYVSSFFAMLQSFSAQKSTSFCFSASTRMRILFSVPE